ncbi:MAG: Dolichyl-phosphate-mannose-protein mannosyltransferase [Actinomycetia bacterium]|nr:Dolichyl-phosphate-mannose-protein mannosyltransferase [Actinomycetes bacterium]
MKPAIGVLAGAASVVLVARERRPRDLIAGGAAAVCAALVVSAPFGLDRVWKQTVDYQASSQREASIHANVAKIATALWDRDVLLLALAAVAIVAALSSRALSSRASSSRASSSDHDATAVFLLWLWVGVVLAFLVVEPALWRNHISSLVVPLALLVALYLPLRRWIVLVLLVIVPLHVYSLRTILHPGPYDRTTLAAHNALEALPSGAWALSDEVGLVWRSHRRTTDYFVDTSIKRQQQGQITAASIAAAASDPRVCGVLVWSAAYWGSFKNLGTLLAAAGYEPKQHFPGQRGVRVLYVKTPCPAPQLRLVG